nr:retrovirus-related Pol polyprotein from transposon TNT 1-94 [Tanacetum cinerariifolium]
MRPFGCHVTILNTKDHLGKFDGKVDEGFFVGYSLNSKAFRVFNNRTRIVKENLHVRFSKNTPNIAESEPNWLFDVEALTKSMNYKPVFARNQSNGNEESKRSQNDGYQPLIADEKKVDEDPRNTFNFSSDHEDDVEEADMNNMDTTIQVFRIKKNERGIVIRNKARLVAQGYTQKEGIDYHEVFVHVARIKAVRLFLVYASFKDFVVYQMDFKSVFLYEKIEEEVYVFQPTRFEDPDFLDKVYKVEKPLHRLHQAPRVWYKNLSTYLLDNGFHRFNYPNLRSMFRTSPIRIF